MSVLLGTSFIYHFIKVIFQSERRVVPYHSKPVAILPTFGNDPIATILDDEEEEDSDGALFRVARQEWLPTMSDSTFLLNTIESGLMLIESHMNISKSRVAVTASVTIDVVPGRPFQVFVANFSDSSAHLPKHILFAFVSGAPQFVLNMGSDTKGDKIDSVTPPPNDTDYKILRSR